ncbi:MAG: flavodoxin family protein [Candidatus Brocadiia bacterium]|jgi:multimeric flavodoxin WrbA|nr:flavodoxin family protein [Candidatus Brocadiia bacterium]
MNVIALNSSPNMDEGGTALILNPFVEGMQEAGAAVEVVYLRQLDINPCTACFACWLKTPGECVQQDDMAALCPKIGASDVIVFATPVYADGMTGTMKTLIDRCIPLLEPFFEVRDGHCRHPVRQGVKPGKVVLVSASGFTELDNFDPLLCHARAIAANFGREFAGALLRPCATALPELEKHGIAVGGVYEAAREAGRELVTGGRVEDKTAVAVSRELVRRAIYVRAINSRFRQILSEAEGA